MESTIIGRRPTCRGAQASQLSRIRTLTIGCLAAAVAAAFPLVGPNLNGVLVERLHASLSNLASGISSGAHILGLISIVVAVVSSVALRNAHTTATRAPSEGVR